jgi:soluble P-type ATPase
MRIPGFGDRHIQTMLADYDGTLSCNGKVEPALKVHLTRLADLLEIHILTADKKAKTKGCFGDLPLHVHILSEMDQDTQKRAYLKGFDAAKVVALGNGNNDRLLFEAVKNRGGLCIAVENGEGCAVDLIIHSHLLIHGAEKAVTLLLDPTISAAALRY